MSKEEWVLAAGGVIVLYLLVWIGFEIGYNWDDFVRDSRSSLHGLLERW